jgi:Uncharacterized proteins involved in stress response, homologs of TerZ and putative cAMP-binding protein CABP1
MSDWDAFNDQTPDRHEEEGGDAAANPDKDMHSGRHSLSADDFMREPEVNYVSSSETVINIGDDIGLTNKDPTLKKIRIGAGWTIRSIEGEPPDFDLSCFMLNNTDQTRMDEDFVFYNNTKSEQEEIKHRGDSRTGAGQGDDENIEIDLQAMSFDISSVMFVLSIHEGEYHEHNFSMIRSASPHRTSAG